MASLRDDLLKRRQEAQLSAAAARHVASNDVNNAVSCNLTRDKAKQSVSSLNSQLSSVDVTLVDIQGNVIPDTVDSNRRESISSGVRSVESMNEQRSVLESVSSTTSTAAAAGHGRPAGTGHIYRCRRRVPVRQCHGRALVCQAEI